MSLSLNNHLELGPNCPTDEQGEPIDCLTCTGQLTCPYCELDKLEPKNSP